MRYFLQKGKLTGPKRSNFVRLPSSVEIHTRSKTKHLRDLLQKMQRWRPRANAFCDFSTSPVQSTVPATEKWGQVIRSAAPVMQNHLSKPEELMLQNATPLRKSAPWPANMSDGDISCTVPAKRSASLQIFFKRPTPALAFWVRHVLRATVAGTFSTSLLPKVLRAQSISNLFTSKCPALCEHLNLQERSGAEVLLTFWLRNVLRATAPCIFQHLKFQKWSKVLRSWGIFNMINYFGMVFAPQRHAFFNMSICKSDPNPKCF